MVMLEVSCSEPEAGSAAAPVGNQKAAGIGRLGSSAAASALAAKIGGGARAALVPKPPPAAPGAAGGPPRALATNAPLPPPPPPGGKKLVPRSPSAPQLANGQLIGQLPNGIAAHQNGLPKAPPPPAPPPPKKPASSIGKPAPQPPPPPPKPASPTGKAPPQAPPRPPKPAKKASAPGPPPPPPPPKPVKKAPPSAPGAPPPPPPPKRPAGKAPAKSASAGSLAEQVLLCALVLCMHRRQRRASSVRTAKSFHLQHRLWQHADIRGSSFFQIHIPQSAGSCEGQEERWHARGAHSSRGRWPPGAHQAYCVSSG